MAYEHVRSTYFKRHARLSHFSTPGLESRVQEAVPKESPFLEGFNKYLQEVTFTLRMDLPRREVQSPPFVEGVNFGKGDYFGTAVSHKKRRAPRGKVAHHPLYYVLVQYISPSYSLLW